MILSMTRAYSLAAAETPSDADGRHCWPGCPCYSDARDISDVGERHGREGNSSILPNNKPHSVLCDLMKLQSSELQCRFPFQAPGSGSRVRLSAQRCRYPGKLG
jgi:hypothetical protein